MNERKKVSPAPMARATELGIAPRPLRAVAMTVGIAGAVGATGMGAYTFLAPDDEGCRTRAGTTTMFDKAADDAKEMLESLKRKLHITPAPPRHVAGEMIALPPTTPTGTMTIGPPPAPIGAPPSTPATPAKP
jgi:hypothetical protein